MKALIDSDVLRYEIGHSGEYFEEGEDGEKVHKVREWEFVQELFEQKIFVIQEQTNSDEPPCLYLTTDSTTVRVYNRWAKTFGYEPIEYKPNFRNDIATVKPYKGTRKLEKPAHYENLTAHIMFNYDFKLGNGVEADDLMAIDQTNAEPLTTTICSRDKDLRQVAGLHYSWECGAQLEIGPIEFDRKGYVEKNGNKVFGGGEMFFIFQLMTGDAVDNIAGCPQIGPVKAIKIIKQYTKRKDLYEAVLELYNNVYGEDGMNYLIENARLLWLLRREDDVWKYPYD